MATTRIMPLHTGIFSADAFEDSLTGYLEGFYSGNTSNGQFNDDTSTAYMVKHFSDGTIKTLYVGNFRNGQFNDTTGNAWMVGTTAPGEPYSYSACQKTPDLSKEKGEKTGK